MIKTKVGDKVVHTVRYNGTWFTLGPGNYEAKNLLDAGQNHLRSALELRKMLIGKINE